MAITLNPSTLSTLVSVGNFSIDNIAALRTYSVINNGAVNLKGYTVSGDGGGGGFYGVTGAAPGTYIDNNGTIIVPTGGDGSAAWMRDVKDGVTIADFGAQGGGADDTIPVNNALAYIVAQGYGTLTFPPGDWLVDNAVMTQLVGIPITERITIIGYGARLGPFTPAPVSGAILTITAQDQWQHFTMLGLTFAGGFDNLVIDGGLIATGANLYRFALDDVSSNSHTNKGITIKGHCFEYSISRPVFTAAAGALRNLHIIDTAGASPGDINIYDPNSRGGAIGIDMEPGHWKMFGGTVITADTYGMQAINSNGATIIGTHFENNWESANDPAQPAWAALTAYVIGDKVNEAGTTYTALTNHTSGTFVTDLATGEWSMDGGAGLKITNNARLIGVRGTTNRNQKYIVELFTASSMSCRSTPPTGNVFRYANIYGSGLFNIDTASYEITSGSPRLAGLSGLSGTQSANGYTSLVDSQTYAATMTPNHAVGTIFSTILTGNITAFNPPDTGGGIDGLPVGTLMRIVITQDAAVAHTVTFNAVFKGMTAISPTLSSVNIWVLLKTSPTTWRQESFASAV